jgi:hypothetical protein
MPSPIDQFISKSDFIVAMNGWGEGGGWERYSRTVERVQIKNPKLMSSTPTAS